MTMNEKMSKCKVFFETLVNMLSDRYEIHESCNQDVSAYLCPVGTTSEVTYHSKPEGSFRISDHWNWYANINKCPDPKYIQCYCVDLPWAHKRPEEGKAGKSIKASCVCIFQDGKYHVVYGECYNRKTRTWSWIDNIPEKILTELTQREG